MINVNLINASFWTKFMLRDFLGAGPLKKKILMPIKHSWAIILQWKHEIINIWKLCVICMNVFRGREIQNQQLSCAIIYELLLFQLTNVEHKNPWCIFLITFPCLTSRGRCYKEIYSKLRNSLFRSLDSMIGVRSKIWELNF